MKALIALFTLMTSSLAFSAETVRVFEDVASYTANPTRSEAKFYLDKESGLGYAQIIVKEGIPTLEPVRTCVEFDQNGPNRSRCLRWVEYTDTTYNYRKVYEHTELIPDLILEGNKILYNTKSGVVDCGTLGVSRIFKVPTLYLNGKCTLKSKIVQERAVKKVIVDLEVRD